MIELGALGWPNGLELSPQTIRKRLQEQGKLHRAVCVAWRARGSRRTPRAALRRAHPRNGGPTDSGYAVFGIAVDTARVYWTRGEAGEVWMRCKGEW